MVRDGRFVPDKLSAEPSWTRHFRDSMPQKLSVGFSAFCTDGLSAAKIVFSLQAVAQKLSLAYTGRLPSFLLGGEST